MEGTGLNNVQEPLNKRGYPDDPRGHQDLVEFRHADQLLDIFLQGCLDTILHATKATAAVFRPLSSPDALLQTGNIFNSGYPWEYGSTDPNATQRCSICEHAEQTGQISIDHSAQCAHLAHDPAFRKRCSHVVAIPVFVKNQCQGILSLYLTHDPATCPLPPELWQSYGDMIGLALENSRLTRDSQRMFLAAERQAIANEIHDSMSQNLFYGRVRISLLCEALQGGNADTARQCLSDISDALDSVQKSVRDLITHFRCQMDPLGLHHALNMLIDGLKARSAISFEYSYPKQQPDLTLEQELQIFHIIQEALNNVVLHSRATQARVAIANELQEILVRITDNGTGLSSLHSPEGHYGLIIMQERARRIGGTLDIRSSSGIGTEIQLTVPFFRTAL